MARIRTIKPDMGESRDISKLSFAARYFFALLLCHLDDDGRAEWMPKKLVGAMYPHDEDVDPKQLKEWLNECINTDLLRMYEVDGIQYIYSPTFTKHQTINKKTESKCPTPPRTDQESSTTEPLREDYGSTTALEVGKEREKEVGSRKSEMEEEGEGEGDTSRPVLAVVSGDLPPSGKFKPPTVDQVRDVMAMRGWDLSHIRVQSEQFHAYYTSNGWKVGRNPMKDFAAAVTNWGNRMVERGIDPKKPPGNSGSGGYKLKTSLELAAEVFGS